MEVLADMSANAVEDCARRVAAELAARHPGASVHLELGPPVRDSADCRFVRIRGLPLELEMRMARSMVRTYPEGNGWSNILCYDGFRGCLRSTPLWNGPSTPIEASYAVVHYYLALPDGPERRVPARFAPLVVRADVCLDSITSNDFFAPATDLDR